MLARLACLMLLGAGLALPALAQDKPIQLKISLWLPPAHPLVVTTKEWPASLEAASGGTIKSTIFPSEQLGKAFDHYDIVRDGIADVGYINPGYQPGRFPVINAAQLPFIRTRSSVWPSCTTPARCIPASASPSRPTYAAPRCGRPTP